MSKLGKLLGIGSDDERFIEGLLDDLDTLKIKYSLKDITLDLGTLTGTDIIQWLVRNKGIIYHNGVFSNYEI